MVNPIKNIGKVLYATMLMAALSGTAFAQNKEKPELDIYNNTKLQGTATTEANVVFKSGSSAHNFLVGWNNVSAEGKSQANVFGLNWSPNKKSKFFAFLSNNSKKTDLEAKLTESIGSFLIAAGAVTNGTFYAGLEHKVKNGEFSVSYRLEHNKIEGTLWKYFPKANLFSGLRRSNRGNTKIVIGMPSDSGPALRYIGTINVKEKDSSHQLMFGTKSSDQNYGLNKGDDRNRLRDQSLFGPSATINPNDPFRYIAPEYAAWLFDGGTGVSARYAADPRNGKELSTEFFRYIMDNPNVWGGIFYSPYSGSGTLGLEAGVTNKKLKVGALVGIKGPRKIGFQFRYNFRR